MICDHCANYAHAVRYEQSCYSESLCPLGQIAQVVMILTRRWKK